MVELLRSWERGACDKARYECVSNTDGCLDIGQTKRDELRLEADEITRIIAYQAEAKKRKPSKRFLTVNGQWSMWEGCLDRGSGSGIVSVWKV